MRRHQQQEPLKPPSFERRSSRAWNRRLVRALHALSQWKHFIDEVQPALTFQLYAAPPSGTPPGFKEYNRHRSEHHRLSSDLDNSYSSPRSYYDHNIA